MLLREVNWGDLLRDLLSCFKEVAFTLVLSNMALLIAVFIYILITENATLSFLLVRQVVIDNVKPAEILVYNLTLLSPALWIMVSNWGARRNPGWFWFFMALQFSIIAGSSAIYGISKAGVLKNADFVNSWAIWSLILAVITWFATLAYDKIVLRKIQDKISGAGMSAGGRSIAEELARQKR